MSNFLFEWIYMNESNLKTAISEKVSLGKRIEISVNGEFQCWDIVNPEGSNILDKKISVDSPLIKLIKGLKSGSKISGKFGSREVVVKIREVYIP